MDPHIQLIPPVAPEIWYAPIMTAEQAAAYAAAANSQANNMD